MSGSPGPAIGVEIEAQLRAYDVAVRGVGALEGGAINQCFRVESDRGPLLLKSYATGIREFEPANLERTLKISEEARLRGVPAPATIANREGSAVTVIEGGRCVVLSEFIEGRQVPRGKMPQECARSMGAQLHRIHEALAELPPPPDFPPRSVSATVDQVERLIRTVEALPAKDATDDAALKVLSMRRRQLAKLADPPHFPTQWGHGDYQDSNVIFEKESAAVAGIIDWDVAGPRTRAGEVMRAYSLSFPQDDEAGLEFLKGYVESARLGPETASAYVDYWSYVDAFRLWPIDVRYEQPRLYQKRWDQFILSPGKAWDETKEDLRAQLVDFAPHV